MTKTKYLCDLIHESEGYLQNHINMLILIKVLIKIERNLQCTALDSVISIFIAFYNAIVNN